MFVDGTSNRVPSTILDRNSILLLFLLLRLLRNIILVFVFFPVMLMRRPVADRDTVDCCVRLLSFVSMTPTLSPALTVSLVQQSAPSLPDVPAACPPSRHRQWLLLLLLLLLLRCSLRYCYCYYCWEMILEVVVIITEE